ncbi:hypothetical protein [Lysobacter sp. Root96]|uniref:hypothetical protein n=1 Tax=Lysobacter sp. Root96 TaxID=1736612 RepID=UPI0006F3C0CE|nr:hypothetical protein [Lysobacter sp. Root96]KRD71414.1 hypothetical protein ASE45_06280 [Lysobacter sp. Root96]
MGQQASGTPEAQVARNPNEIQSISNAFQLKHCPVEMMTNSVHRLDYEGMQVGLSIDAGLASSKVYLTTAEARTLAQQLIVAADHFDAEAAKAGAQ